MVDVFAPVQPRKLNPLTKGAAWLAARLPRCMENLVLGERWYNDNGYYKYAVGQVVRSKQTGESYRVVGYVVQGYHLQSLKPDGASLFSSKWGVEYEFVRVAKRET
jgi:hypothetical protein